MSATAAVAGACSPSDRDKIVPYTKNPSGTVPGAPDRFASVFPEAGRAHPVLVVTREGRPIHVEGNDLHPDSLGKAPLRAIAGVLDLYDPDRLRLPLLNGRRCGWDQALSALRSALESGRKSGKPALLLTGRTASPTRRALIAELGAAFPLRWIEWEPAPCPQERLSLGKAKIIVCFEADILSGEVPSWVLDFAKNRRGGDLSRLYVLEGAFSLTGGKADHRLSLRPSRAAEAAGLLTRALAAPGRDLLLDDFAGRNGLSATVFRGLAADLSRHRGAAVAVCGPSLPPEAREAVARLNAALGAEGRLIQTNHESSSGFRTLRDALEDAAQGAFSAAVFWGANPAYSFPDAALWKRSLAGLPFKASIGAHVDETALDCGLVFPENHWLESWGDHESDSGFLTLQQPALSPLYDTLQGEDILRLASGKTLPEYRLYLEERWRKKVHAPGDGFFDRFWTSALHDGFLRVKTPPVDPPKSRPRAEPPAAAREGFELILAPSLTVFDGRYGGNGWLQETPDPLTKQTWGNALLVSVADAGRLGLREGQIVKVEAGGRSSAIPVFVQEGQAPGVLSARLGYGRRTGNVARDVGANLYPLIDCASPCPFLLQGVSLTPTSERADLALTQNHHRMEGRDIARSLPVSRAGSLPPPHPIPTMNPAQDFPVHKWGMAVDLSMCVGCSACVVACQSENNIPCVGPEQVRRGREMHWIRVDRYLLGEADALRTVSQPMLCQHCDDAPCETVCPVSATNHSPEGLNQMAYNRCVGTRYCANNCPYKVRRFNFFEYNDREEPEILAHNPEVTVRPRGVMEKCTFCVQRISDVKQLAKAQGRGVRDGEVLPACAAACPAGAIVFGDLKDSASRVNSWSQDPRGYKVLEEVGARPAVTYLAELTNPLEDDPRNG